MFNTLKRQCGPHNVHVKKILWLQWNSNPWSADQIAVAPLTELTSQYAGSWDGLIDYSNWFVSFSSSGPWKLYTGVNPNITTGTSTAVWQLDWKLFNNKFIL